MKNTYFECSRSLKELPGFKFQDRTFGRTKLKFNKSDGKIYPCFKEFLKTATLYCQDFYSCIKLSHAIIVVLKIQLHKNSKLLAPSTSSLKLFITQKL